MQLARLGRSAMPGLIIALSGSIWAAHRSSCKVCNNVPKLFNYSLAWPGVIFYSTLLVGQLANKENIIKWPLVGAAYAHGVLLIKMVIDNRICPACILTAIGTVYAAKSIN